MVSSTKEDEIGELIKQENDPKMRAFLVLLKSIDTSLLATTKLTADVDKQLREHMVAFRVRSEREDELLNKGKGMWKFLSLALGALQAIAVAMLMHVTTELKVLSAADNVLTARVLTLETYRAIDHESR